MPITENSILAVRDASIIQIVSHYIKLNHHGQAHCPFHDEKTPSFKVSESKSIFKCFGCGKGGDGIEFVMKYEHTGFINAVEKIASIIGLLLEYEEVPDKEKYEKQKAEKDLLKDTLRLATEKYNNQLWNLPAGSTPAVYLTERNILKEDIAEWQLGWAGTEWKFLTTSFIEKGLYEPSQKLGLIRRTQSGDSNYDGFRSRITIPITNHNGELIGLAGRWLLSDHSDTGKDYPKYINTPENEIYSKSLVLFGLARASKAISNKGFAFLVEGYFDVVSMHKNGNLNTIGTCGTALTTQQVLLLKKYTNYVVVLRDSDAAGLKAAQRDIPILLKNGFETKIALLPGMHDPDSFILALSEEQKGQGIDSLLSMEDGFFWLVALLVEQSSNDEFRLGTSKAHIMELLARIPNAIVRSNYFNSLIKKYQWAKSDLQKQLNILVDQENEAETEPEFTRVDKMPKWMDKEEFLRNGYCSVKNKSTTGYYTLNASGQLQITNFLITPLFHVSAGNESRHLIKIDNGVVTPVLDIESAALVSIEMLQKIVVRYGAFVIYGSKIQMLRIATNLLHNFPMCFDIKFLGWQPFGFFAFVDKVFIPGAGLMELSEWGIIKHSDKNYLIPAASAAYRELQGYGDDPYENHRVLTYVKAEITFEQWASLMHRVYPEKGLVGIAYIILTVFRDIIFSIDNNVPHLYAFGERSAGKSKWAESIGSFFYKSRSAFNLNSGTDFAFFYYMQLFCNCPAHLNEFDEKIIKPEWFQSIKGVFDGEGRQRGVMGSSNRSEIMKVKSTLVLTGQFLCTMDDNSIVSRSIIEGFNERDVTEEDQKEFNRLKGLEEAGLSSLVSEVLQYREEFKARYKNSFNEVLSRWRRLLSGDSVNFNQRIMQNWCHLFTCYEVMSKYISLPVLPETFENYCKGKAVQWSGFIRSSDTLSEFWNTFAFLVDTSLITEGWDFKIKTESTVRVRKDRKDEIALDFPEPTKVIYIRMNNVHKHYQQAYRARTGKEGMSMENLLHYFSSRKYYIGPNKSSTFKRWVNRIEQVSRQNGQSYAREGEFVKSQEEQRSSSIMFLYDHLSIDVERTQANGLDEIENDQENKNLPFPL